VNHEGREEREDGRDPARNNFPPLHDLHALHGKFCGFRRNEGCFLNREQSRPFFRKGPHRASPSRTPENPFVATRGGANPCLGRVVEGSRYAGGRDGTATGLFHQPPSENAIACRRRFWVAEGKMIVFVSDEDLREMMAMIAFVLCDLRDLLSNSPERHLQKLAKVAKG
jgi:hypothetical protein